MRDVERGTFLDTAFDKHLASSTLTERERAFVYQIVSGVVRWRDYLDWIIGRLSVKAPRGETRALLRISLYQLWAMRKGAHHVVKETVDVATATKGGPAGKYVNALLRRYLREKDDLPYPEKPLERMALINSFPAWLVRRWVGRFGEESTRQLLSHLNEAPHFCLRVNLSRRSRDQVLAELRERGIDCRPGLLSPSSLTVPSLHGILNSDLMAEGLLSVQDEASQLVGLAVRPSPGERILDACAGLGTKTRQLMEICPQANLISFDNSRRRLLLINPPGQRVEGDGLAPPFKGESFDTILLDAPCSSLGIVRKHPELKWRRSAKDVEGFGRLQADLLSSLWPTLKPGGHLVYSVCSFEPEETTAVLDNVRKKIPFVLENPLPFLFNMEYFLSLPDKTGVDGFFIARLRKP